MAALSVEPEGQGVAGGEVRRPWASGGCGFIMTRSAIPFRCRLPARIAPEWVFSLPEHMVWCASMARTDDGVCHLYFSRWPRAFGHSAWVTHSEIAYATAERPEGPYRYRGVALPARGGVAWDGHMTHNPHVLLHDGRFYLYYTGTRGPASWRDDRPESSDRVRWAYRMNQRVGVAVADSPEGPWRRFEQPLISPGAEFGEGLTATPGVIQRREGDFLLVYKSQEAGPGTYTVEGSRGGGVFHYPALARDPLGPFRRAGGPMVDKRKIFHRHFDYHIDDHVEWMEAGRYYAIVKDHDAPFLTRDGKVLYMLESNDGIAWSMGADPVVTSFALDWRGGSRQRFERLEMPKVYLAAGRPQVLFLAALPADDPTGYSYNLAIPLLDPATGVAPTSGLR